MDKKKRRANTCTGVKKKNDPIQLWWRHLIFSTVFSFNISTFGTEHTGSSWRNGGKLYVFRHLSKGNSCSNTFQQGWLRDITYAYIKRHRNYNIYIFKIYKTNLTQNQLTKSIVLAFFLDSSSHQVSHQSHSWGRDLIATWWIILLGRSCKSL